MENKNFEKNIEKEASSERNEYREDDFEFKESRKTQVEEEKQKQSAPSAKVSVAKDSPIKGAKVSPVISKKMQFFLDLAEEKGLPAAIKAVEKENDPLLLDSFHDALAKEKLFEGLLKKKK